MDLRTLSGSLELDERCGAVEVVAAHVAAGDGASRGQEGKCKRVRISRSVGVGFDSEIHTGCWGMQGMTEL